MKRCLSALLAFILSLCGVSLADFSSESAQKPVLRALLVTCDRFVSQPETTPAAQRNAEMMRQLLSSDERSYDVLRVECDTLSTVDSFQQAVAETFGQAEDQDISVLYVSTHGLYTPNRTNLAAALLLSDGVTQERLTAQRLSDILSPVRGTKVVLLDACHSGAFIGKGLSDPVLNNPFAGEGFQVLCSAGGSEESWYWRAEGGETLNGAGYFTSILASGLGAGLPADRDGDRCVTMAEIRAFLLSHYAASTPQISPEAGDFVLFRGKDEADDADEAVRDISFDSAVFWGSVVNIGFSFTLSRPVSVSYQLVYDRRGRWDFANAPMMADGGDDGVLEAGSYQRNISLRLGDEAVDVSGYLMLQIYSQEESRMVLHESRLLRVYPSGSDVALEVETASRFTPGLGEEMPVCVRHDVPCSLTVTVQNLQGRTIRYLALDEASRPQRLTPEGSCFYWDGRMDDGSPAPAGRYLIRVQTDVAGQTYYAYSGSFVLSVEVPKG